MSWEILCLNVKRVPDVPAYFIFPKTRDSVSNLMVFYYLFVYNVM